MAELASLIKIRGRLKGRLTAFSNFVERAKTETDRVAEIPDRLEKLEKIWVEFETIQDKIEELDEQNVQSSERTSFEDAYFANIAAAKALLPTNERVSPIAPSAVPSLVQNNVPQLNSVPSQTSVKLPNITLPKFNGNYEQWITFRDLFTSLIHDNTSLIAVQKLHYLKASLHDDASQVLKSIEITNDNYNIAWNLLEKRYENKRLIVQHHIQALIELPSIIKESHFALRQLVDDVTLRVQTLLKLEQPVNTWDTLLIHLLLPKIDKGSRREWEQKRASIESFPTLKEFTEFLTQRSAFLEAVGQSNTSQHMIYSNSSHNENKTKKVNKQVSHVYVSSESHDCPICEGNHKIYQCSTFRNLIPIDRIKEVKNKKLCIKCLKAYHGRNCGSVGCKKCKGYHNTLLHIGNKMTKHSHDNNNVLKTEHSTENSVPVSNSNNTTQAPVVQENRVSTSYSHCATLGPSQILLSTAIVRIRDRFGKMHECRALLDSGSQSNFITRELSNKLQLTKQKVNTTILSLNEVPFSATQQVCTTIYSRYNAYQVKPSFFILDKITEDLPVTKVNTNNFNIPHNITLADPTYHTPGKIDLLLGASVFWDLLCIGQFRISNRQPIFQKTHFGWIISGSVESKTAPSSTVTSHCYFSSRSNLQNQIEKFWKVEEMHMQPHLSPEERMCEEHFQRTYQRNHDGRFIVSLPLKDTSSLGESRTAAERRFFNMERKLEKQPEIKEAYHSFIREYLDLNHMVEVHETHEANNIQYYLPHHAVMKESTTTKLRVVFDASCPTSTGKSLNDLLLVGPTIQPELFSIITRFRQHNFVISADIAKMYRQVLVDENQWDFQRILWRWSKNEPLSTYALKTVTYGMSSSPFLAIRCLYELAKIHQDVMPEVCRTISQDFYVDDLLTGHNDLNQLINMKEEVTKVLASAKFELRKWKSNVANLNDDSSTTNSSVQLGEATKTLGLLWNPSMDTLHYNANTTVNGPRITKRMILSSIAQIYDPLGLLGPVVVKVKIILQRLWQLNLGWDESVPISVHSMWTQWNEQIHHLNSIGIPRHVVSNNWLKLEMHGFSDASETAYGACVYLRSITTDNKYIVRLLCAKSRVAPLKQLTLPRLELCAAVLLANLCAKVLEALTIPIDESYYWSDSRITLAWIAKEPYQWATFVANRIAEIHRLTNKKSWHHVRSECNPADLLSRGLNPEELADCSMWWNGPEMLQHELILNDHLMNDVAIDIPEVRRTAITMTTINKPSYGTELITRFSSLMKLVRVVAYCLRFKFNSLNPKSKLIGALTASELRYSLDVLIKLVQKSEFSQERDCLKNKLNLPRTSKLLTLHPFIDESGLIRVGGRLRNAPINYSQKHPVVLPTKHHLTELIIRNEHYKNLHAGPQALLANIRTRYWPLSGKQAVRRVLRSCLTCFRTRPMNCEQLMGDLPSPRVTPTRAFLNSGLDYAGPFAIKLSRNKTGKAYLCIFVCFSTKAVHLELVSDLSTPAFLNTLKRFIARRGKCSNLYSDNGTNFVGANNQLQELKTFFDNTAVRSQIHEYLSDQFINWHFIPPYSPHMGGLWEAAVKSAKTHMRKIIGSTPLYFEELYTVITQIEACLNSRPLTCMSSDPTDLSVLTPGHFLIGEPLTAIPEFDVSEVPVNRLTRYQLLVQMRQHFWSRWSREYISQLQP